jgi:hypothetical protein
MTYDPETGLEILNFQGDFEKTVKEICDKDTARRYTPDQIAQLVISQIKLKYAGDHSDRDKHLDWAAREGIKPLITEYLDRGKRKSASR